MPTPDEINTQAQAQDDWNAMVDAVRNRDVDASNLMGIEPEENDDGTG